jgi:cytochrome c553
MPLTTLRTLFLSLTLALASPWLAAADTLMADMRERTQACTACHGPQGKAGPDGYYPRLAGKPADYLYNQLRNFQDNRRHYPLMQGLLAPLSDAYLRDMATYFSQLEVPYPAPSPSTATPEQLARGKALATAGDPTRGLPACTQCHGSGLTGVLPQTPGLLGLPRDYLNAQLGGWQTGQRRAPAPDCMAAVAQALRPDEVQAVTAWLAAQPVPPGAKPAAAPTGGPTLPARWRCAATAPLPALTTTSPAAVPATPTSNANSTSTHSADSTATQTVARGAYLARLGNCALCHTTAGGEPYAGGRGIDTPFGTVYSSNLTPDAQYGLGRWSAQDFWNALHHGTSKDGRALYPAFPYTSYTHLSRADSDALFAFLRTVPAAPTANTPHALRWPYSSQAALGTWRALYFSPGENSTAASAAPRSSQRGAYIAQALTHCSECHGQRNALGALQPDKAWAGATLPGGLGYAPSLQSTQEASLATWRVEDIVALLRTGRAPAGSTRGTMAEVVLHSTQYLTDDDAYALATYLQNLPQTAAAPARTASPPTAASVPGATNASTRGGKLYTQYCADCHGAQGQGRAGAIAALAGNRAVLQANTSNLIRTVLHGGFGPATAGNPRPWGMPPFMLQLNNTDVAAVLTYVRSSWGNTAPAVSEFDINQLRNTIRP